MASQSRRLVTALMLVAIAAPACKKKGDDATEASRPEAVSRDVAAPAPAPSAGSGSAAGAGGAAAPGAAAIKPPRDDRKVIRTGNVEIIADKLDASRVTLEGLVRAAGGYIDSTNVTHAGNEQRATIVARIPSDGFGDLLGKLAAVGEVTAETTSAQDITADYVDTTARLAAQKVLEQRLLALAADRTGNVEQVLEVERELARVRGEIESYQGHVRQWDDQVAMSTLTFALRAKEPPIAIVPPRPAPTLGARSSSAFHDSIDALRDTMSSLLVALIALLPWLVIGTPIVVFGRRVLRRRRLAIPHAQVVVSTPAVATAAAADAQSQ